MWNQTMKASVKIFLFYWCSCESKSAQNSQNSSTFRSLSHLRRYHFVEWKTSGYPSFKPTFLKPTAIDQSERGSYSNRPIANDGNAQTRKWHELETTPKGPGLERTTTPTDPNLDPNPKTNRPRTGTRRTNRRRPAFERTNRPPRPLHSTFQCMFFASTNVKSRVTLNYFCNVF